MRKRWAVLLLALTLTAGGCAGTGEGSSASGDGGKPTGTTTQTTQGVNQMEELTDHVRFFGRTYTVGKVVFFDWTQSGFTFSFRGTEARAELAAMNKSLPEENNDVFLQIQVDGGAPEKLRLQKGRRTYVLAENLPEGEHVVRVTKISEAQHSYCGLKEIQLQGEWLPPPAEPEGLKLEFVGDSVTCGMGNLTPEGWQTDTTLYSDGSQTYAAVAAERLGACYQVIAASGCGVVRDAGNAENLLMGRLYEKTQGLGGCTEDWDFSRFVPDAVIVNLGTNDSGVFCDKEELREGMKALLDTIRRCNPQAKIVWAYGLMNRGYFDEIRANVEAYAQQDDKVYFVELPLQNIGRDGTGLGGHPNTVSHELAGEALAEALRGILDA